MPITSRLFGTSPAGDVTLFSLKSGSGVCANIINHGAALVSLLTPDRHGALKNIVLGHNQLEDYQAERGYLGAIVGRYANRIANACFSLDGQQYVLPVNNAPNHIHGGPKGFDKVLWQATAYENASGCGVRLTYASPHLDQGYPGALQAGVDYYLAADGILSITLTASSDRPTIVNMTTHSYFNLSNDETILGHRLKLYARAYTPVDKYLIPTGDVADVAGTPFDFRAPKVIGADLSADHPQLALSGGFDHNFIVDGTPGELRPVAEVSDPGSGRVVSVSSTQPGVQFYTGQNLPRQFAPHSGLCLETQHYPDSPNQASFPTTLIQPGVPYRERIEYRFNVFS